MCTTSKTRLYISGPTEQGGGLFRGRTHKLPVPFKKNPNFRGSVLSRKYPSRQISTELLRGTNHLHQQEGGATVHYTVIGCIQEILGNVASVHIFTVVFMETMQEILLRHLLATRCLPWLFLGPKNWAVCHTPLPPGTSSFLCE